MSRNEKNKKCFIVMAIVLVGFAFSPPQAGAGTLRMEEQKLTASYGAAGDLFGTSASVSGDYAIVGVPYDDDKGSASGSAYMFKFCPRADLNDDCKVDFADFAIFADWWLYGTD